MVFWGEKLSNSSMYVIILHSTNIRSEARTPDSVAHQARSLLYSFLRKLLKGYEMMGFPVPNVFHSRLYLMARLAQRQLPINN